MSAAPTSEALTLLHSKLASVLAYKNEDVVSRFAEDHHVPLDDAEILFTEMKRWLWLCAKRQLEIVEGAEAFQIPLFNEAFAIDLMWHTFLLFTEDYAQFCETHFGFFIHHRPRPQAERKAWQAKIATNPEATRQEREESLRKVYTYIYDELGPDILVRWCEEFPARFKFEKR